MGQWLVSSVGLGLRGIAGADGQQLRVNKGVLCGEHGDAIFVVAQDDPARSRR
jgi:hypothetical protein